jgi:hypothetical protein
MIIEPIKFKSKSWGVIELPYAPGHYHTGYEREWPLVGTWDEHHDATTKIGVPVENMKIGENVIITGLFRLVGMSRGRSAANFSGHFRKHENVSYDFGMQGAMTLISYIQMGLFPVKDGFIDGRWTFAKQGNSIFLTPAAPVP